MPRNDFHIRRHLRDHFLHGVDHPIDAAAAIHVDERKTIRHEIVAHVHDIGLGEEDDRIAIGVAGGKEERPDIFAIQMHGHVVIERDDRQRFFGCGLHIHVHRAAIAGGAARFQSLAHIVLRDDRRLLLEIRVPAGVIAVIVRVDDEPHRLVGDAFQRRLNFLGERGVLIVDNHNSIVPDRCANVPSRAFQHVNVAGHLGDLHLDFAEILLLRRSQAP